jgi:PAS domain S-box-containing protein
VDGRRGRHHPPIPLWEEFTGQAWEEYRGAGWVDAVHPDDRERAAAAWREAVAGRSFYQAEYRLRRRDGAWRHTIARGAPILDAAGGVVEWMGASVDVTEERETERRERFLADLSEQTRVLGDPDAVLANTGSALGEFLGAVRVCYSEVDLTAGTAAVRRDWATGGLPSLVGVWPLASYGADVAATLARGETVAVADFAADPLTRDAAPAYAALGAGSFVCVPFMRGGVWEASLVVMWTEARPGLDPDEVELIEAVAERTGLALENARLVRGLEAENTERREAERRALLRAEQLRKLAEAAVAVNACVSLDEMFPLIADRARDIVGAHQAVTSITRGEGGVSPDWSQAINALSLSEKYEAWRDYATLPDGSGIYTAVCRENRPMRLTQAELLAHPGWRGFGPHAADHPPMNGWLAVPLIGGDGANLGLVQLSDKYEGEFDAEDEAILVQLAQQASLAIENRRLLEETRAANRRIAENAARYERIAETLQRSLLHAPSGRLAFPGLSVEPVYEAALDEAQVGGDFFDAFALDGGLVALVVGDVTGKGLVAASFTAEVKFALRAFLSEGPDPAAALTRLNRLLTGPGRAGSEDGGSTFVALALCVVDPATGALTAAAAGAEPPQVVRAGADGAAAAEMAVGGVLLGVDAGAEYDPVSDILAPGDLLVMCTDGLTEARRPVGRRDFFGPEGVAAAAQGAAHLPTLADTAGAVVAAALDFAGGRQADDVCLVLARLSFS